MNRRSAFDVPIATYRLQLNRDFGFDRAREILPYLASLGISHVYASPFLKARSGSSHGYDVVDYSCLNPELGDDSSFEHFCAALAENNLGLILDFVPNHMGIGKADNRWWLDVLEWGEASPYGRYFDIDWSPSKRDLEHKLLVPILGKTYGEALTDGEILLRFDASAGRFDFWYHDHRLPLSPRDYPAVLGQLKIIPELDRAVRRLEDAVLAESPSSSLRASADALKAALVVAARIPETESAIEKAASAWQGSPGDASSFTRVHELLQRQAYRLAYWRTASDEINYRRFFDIGDLAGVRMDRIRVFHDAHEFLGRLLAAGKLQGLRIDHVDGLADPQRYCRRLNAFAAAIVPRNAEGRRLRPYILVEKILAEDEALAPSWPVAGTTGYDCLALVNGLFIDRTGFVKLQRHWSRFTGLALDLTEEFYRCRRLVVDRSLSSELNYLVNCLVDITEADWFTRDFTRKRLRDALAEIVSAFAVYRTYVTERGASDFDRAEIGKAIDGARERWNGTDEEILDFIRSLLTLDITNRNFNHYVSKKAAILRFITRFQQYTGAIAAKSVEDTLFYRYVPLASANEVGAAPSQPTTTIDAYHAKAVERAALWPHTMFATATHDTKRGEDMRARLDVLSEMPDEWARRVARWHIYNRVHRDDVAGAPLPTLNDEYLLYQSIVGTWPMQAGRLLRSDEHRRDYVDRLKAYAIKCSREAKITTSWIAPNEAYEKEFGVFIEKILDNPHQNPFVQSLMRFLPTVLHLGAFNSLAQLVLKAMSPGVPDFYQGNEFWDLSMVDPDNRRPVDYTARVNALHGLNFATASARWREGWLKLWVTRRLLELRNRLPDVFRDGSYEPLTVDGPGKDHLLAFQRRLGRETVVVVVARFNAATMQGDLSGFWPDGNCFNDSRVGGLASGRWIDELSDVALESCSRGLLAAQALSSLPVAVLRAS